MSWPLSTKSLKKIVPRETREMTRKKWSRVPPRARLAGASLFRELSRVSRALLTRVGATAGDAAGIVALVGAEFGPHGKVIRDLLRLGGRQVQRLSEVVDARAAQVLGGRRQMDHEVVVQLVLP